MPRCYLAGPMRHKRRFNFPAFFRNAAKLSKLGWDVINPAALDVAAGVATRDGRLRRVLKFDPKHLREFARRDLDVILNKLRGERGDAIILLPGWRRSIGAKAERAAARWTGLRILRLREAIMEGKVEE